MQGKIALEKHFAIEGDAGRLESIWRMWEDLGRG